MIISIEFDSDLGPSAAVIKVDGRKLGRLQELDLHIGPDGGRLLLSRLMPGYGNRFLNRRDIRLETRGGAWKEP